MSRKTELWERQRLALRDPLDVLSTSFERAGLAADCASYQLEGEFASLLQRHEITLLVTREYEHLVLALRAGGSGVTCSYMPLPHPSGLAVERSTGRVYVAATRNPNQIVELSPVAAAEGPELVPSRVKFYPGRYYFHDLAFVGGDLHANSVGQNGVLRVDFNSPVPEELCWWPRCMEDENGRPATDLNYIQLNSIAAGDTLENSFFTASSAARSRRRPWHLNYPVDGRGVLFSGSTREVAGSGLTRPHSARFDQGRVWVNNSGYGQVGFFDEGRYHVLSTLPGWTRGLAIHNGVAWVGVSRVLPKYASYAPGLDPSVQRCGIVAVDLASGRHLGSLFWPKGNQIFAIEHVNRSECAGFPYKEIGPSRAAHRESFYQYKAVKRGTYV
jgi:uncharacterized protein (TIGR03032 family)